MHAFAFVRLFCNNSISAKSVFSLRSMSSSFSSGRRYSKAPISRKASREGESCLKMCVKKNTVFIFVGVVNGRCSAGDRTDARAFRPPSARNLAKVVSLSLTKAERASNAFAITLSSCSRRNNSITSGSAPNSIAFFCPSGLFWATVATIQAAHMRSSGEGSRNSRRTGSNPFNLCKSKMRVSNSVTKRTLTICVIDVFNQKL